MHAGLHAVTAPAWDAAWSHALTELELDVAEAEALLRADHAGPVELRSQQWVPPTGLGPLPAPLVERAQALLDRQLDVARRTAAAALLSRRHLVAVDAMRERPPAVPVYLDTQG
ncbi:hypothetical protein [Cellulomonas cellasea]|nr:hypothetical protein [Cellulomonas cellasea]GEA90139.1 hypothetical protein CCE01nite_40880 [Cellulomonas cellasea]